MEARQNLYTVGIMAAILAAGNKSSRQGLPAIGRSEESFAEEAWRLFRAVEQREVDERLL